jgi:hypothetical protein
MCCYFFLKGTDVSTDVSTVSRGSTCCCPTDCVFAPLPVHMQTSEYTGDTLSWCRLWRDDTVASGAGQYCLELAAREAFPFNPPFPPM